MAGAAAQKCADAGQDFADKIDASVAGSYKDRLWSNG